MEKHVYAIVFKTMEQERHNSPLKGLRARKRLASSSSSIGLADILTYIL